MTYLPIDMLMRVTLFLRDKLMGCFIINKDYYDFNVPPEYRSPENADIILPKIDIMPELNKLLNKYGFETKYLSEPEGDKKEEKDGTY